MRITHLSRNFHKHGHQKQDEDYMALTVIIVLSNIDTKTSANINTKDNINNNRNTKDNANYNSNSKDNTKDNMNSKDKTNDNMNSKDKTKTGIELRSLSPGTSSPGTGCSWSTSVRWRIDRTCVVIIVIIVVSIVIVCLI